MFRKKFIDKLREKYQFGGPRRGLSNPYLTLQGKNINTSEGQRFGIGAKMSAPLLESRNYGKSTSGLRFETDFTGTNAGPISISDNEKAYNSSIGLRGFHNNYLNRDNSLSLSSNIGAGIGTGDATLDNTMNPFIDANLSLLKSGTTRKGTNISGGPTLSYGTEGSPNQGLNLGLKGNYGRLSGDVSYDFTNKTPRAGLSLNFKKGGFDYSSDKSNQEMSNSYSNIVDNENIQYSNDMQRPQLTYVKGKGFDKHSGLPWKEATRLYKERTETKYASVHSSRNKNSKDYTYNEAFHQARANYEKTFTHNGKEYSTRLKEETVDQFEKSFVKGSPEYKAKFKEVSDRRRIGLTGNYTSSDRSGAFPSSTAKTNEFKTGGGMYTQMQQYKKGGDKDKKAVDNENLVEDYTDTYYGDGFSNHVSEKELKEHLERLNVTENDTMLHMPNYLDGGSGMLMQVYEARRDLLNKSGNYKYDEQDYTNPDYLSEFEKYRKNDSETLKDLPISTSNKGDFRFFKIPKTHNVKETGGMYNQIKQYEGGGPKYNLTGDYKTAAVSGTEMVDESGKILPMSPAYLQDPKYGSGVDLQGNSILDESGMPTWYGPSKINTGMLSGNSYSSMNDPSFNNTTPFNRESQSRFGLAYPDIKKTGGMYDQMRQYEAGGKRLPGGEMQPIPGSDAVQFNGQSHDQGGIMVDSQTEVEGGETMDKVTMAKKGGLKDYFFSDHLKEGGRSYAEMHKEILANGGNQEEINTLARMQESAAGRNPKQVAKLGGVMKYDDGGEFEKFELARLQQLYPDVERENLKEHHAKITAQNTQTKSTPVASSAVASVASKAKSVPAPVKYTSPFTTKEEEKAFQDWANVNNYNTKGYGWGKASQDAYDKGYGDYIKSIEESSEALDNAGTEEVIDNESNVVVDKKRGRLEGLDADQTIFDNLQGMLDNGRTLTPEQQADYDRVFLSLGDDRMTTLQRRAEEERIASEKKQFDDANKKLAKKGDVPAIAYVAGAAQLAPAVYSMFHKQPDAEQSVYTPGFTSPIIAEQGKASELERVNYNAERSANAADMRGVNRFIETSGGGPANIINKMSAYARKQAGNMKITAAETRANTDIANREAQMQQQMDVSNMQRAQQASMTNAQLSRAETARMDQIGQINAQARQKLKDDQEAMKYQGFGLAAQGIAGLAGDVMSYQGQERLARGIGTEGRYERDLLRNLVRKQNPEWDDTQINDFITQYNTTT